ncbi:hypothetical protein N7513_000008 [Penicillium frequentans]|nr:hypothetical protein N7513_004677 [Penicillium glabrum]KAJ5563766.1 hypothetical protein N7513_000008 [Penicillium glabrum]
MNSVRIYIITLTTKYFKVARDVFSIPIIGAGIKRLFNSTRDIYHYRRGSLQSSTIQDLIMFRYILNFEIDQDEITLSDRVYTREER